MQRDPAPPAPVDKVRWISTVAGAAALLTGGGHVLAWLSGLMVHLPASTIIMKTNAGLGLCAAGLALMLVAQSRSDSSRRLARVLAVFVLAIGAATLAEHVFGWNLQIDQLIANEPAGAAATVSPNRMGPHAAISFVFLGVALLSLARSSAIRLRTAHEPLALFVGLFALLSVIGYLYDANELYAVARITGIAWPTAASLVILSIGVLCSRPREGLIARVTADDAGGAIVRAVLGPIILLPIAFGWVRLTGERLGWFDAAMGTGLMMLLFIVTFSSLLLFAGRRVSLASAAARRSDDALVARAAEQQALLNALQRSDQQFRTLIENVSAGVALIDETGRFALYNRQFLNMFGLAPDSDIRNINDQDWSAWQVFDEHGQLLGVDEHPVRKAAIAGRGVRGQLVKVLRPNREAPVWMLVSAEPLYGANGKLERVICTYSDVTDRRAAEELLAHDIAERKRVEEALRRSEEKFAKAFHGNTAAMAITRISDGRYIDVNDRFSDVTGFAREYAVGRTTSELHIWKDPRDREAFVRALQETGVVQNVECRFLRPNGEEWLALVASQISHIEGEPVSISSFSDITEAKRAEQALRASEEALQQANARLAEADRRKDEFLGVLSHELRNPLAPVRAALYVLDHAAPSGDQASRAKSVIDRQITQLSRLVDDLLDLTRISRGKVHLRREPLELNALVLRTAEDHRDLFAGKGVELQVKAYDEELWIDGDNQRLAQVVGNLLHNAAKFTEAGGRTSVTVAREPGSQAAVISVCDTGIGISPTAADRLFEPFMQVDATMDRARGGLGLGLSLVKSLTEMHGGTVSVKSEGIGRGAEFTISLPLKAAPPVIAPPATASHHRARRIFIIEDNVDAADTLREALEMAGHQVEVAYDGTSGIEKARKFKPEILLCDIGLPGMNGYEVARKLRSDSVLASVYLIALTGYALPEDVAKAREAGFDLHVAKPPDPARLQEAFASFSR